MQAHWHGIGMESIADGISDINFVTLTIPIEPCVKLRQNTSKVKHYYY